MQYNVNDSQIVSVLESHRAWLSILAQAQLGPRLRRKLDPDDVVQDAMLRAYQGRTEFKAFGSRKGQRRWLGTILRNVVNDHLKHFATAKRDVSRELSPGVDFERPIHHIENMLKDTSRTASSIISKEEQFDRAVSCLERLPDHIREAMIEFYINQRSVQEIAELTGDTTLTITGRLRRGLQRLQQELRKPIPQSN